MNVRRVFGPDPSYRPGADPDFDEPDLVELAPVRYMVMLRTTGDLQALASTTVLIAALALVLVLAIATSEGWSITNAWSG